MLNTPLTYGDEFGLLVSSRSQLFASPEKRNGSWTSDVFEIAVSIMDAKSLSELY